MGYAGCFIWITADMDNEKYTRHSSNFILHSKGPV